MCKENLNCLLTEKCTNEEKIRSDERANVFEELKGLLRCRNYRGCIAGKGCDGVCRIDSDICKKCENFGIPYSLLEQMQKGKKNDNTRNSRR